MTEINSINQLKTSQYIANGDEIDLKLIIGALLRHKFLIAKVASSILLISGVYAFTKKPVWEGQFQIVLEPQASGTGLLEEIASNNSILSSISEVGRGGKSQLKTVVKVLESPSVLKPIYDFVKASKSKKGEDVKNWDFITWRKENLDIQLLKGTSVLNISYRDTDPDIVLPVIKQISSQYQQYSGLDRTKSINNGLEFTKNQVTKFRKQAANSSRALDAFSIQYGISNSGESISGNEDLLNARPELSKPFNTAILSLSKNRESLFEDKQGNPLAQLAAINQQLIRRQQLFTNQDPGVISLIRERDGLRRYIEMSAGGAVTMPGMQLQGKEQAQEIILKFRELKRKSNRDIATLNTLERSLLSLQLEQARQTEPWKLISTPTLLDRPVAPRKKIVLAVGLLTGLIFGSASALITDRRSGLIFSEDELKSLLPFPLLKHLPSMSRKTWTDAAGLLVSGPLNDVSGNSSIALIPLGKIPSDQIEAFSVELRRALRGRELLVSNDLRETSRCSTQLLLAAPGTSTRIGVSQFCQELALQGSPIAGWILLDPKLDLE